MGIAPLCAQALKGPNLKLTREQGSLETLAEDDGRDHPAVATPGVVPAGPKRDRGAPSAESGPRASAADSEPGEGQETNGRHTWRTSATCLSCVSQRPSDSPRIRRCSPSSAAEGHLHAPLQRGSRSPACGPPLPGAASRHAHPADRNFREPRFAPPTRRDGTSGSNVPLKGRRAGGWDLDVLLEEACCVGMRPLGGGSRASSAGRLHQGRAAVTAGRHVAFL